jgi:hypothetical protein
MKRKAVVKSQTEASQEVKEEVIDNPQVITSLSKFLEDELLYWRGLEAGENPPDIKFIIHGGTTEVMYLMSDVKKLTRKYLLGRYHMLSAEKSEATSLELATLSAERNKKAMEAIKRIGIKVNELFDKSKK